MSEIYRLTFIPVFFICSVCIVAQQDTTVTIDEYLEYFADESTVDEDNSQLIETIELLIQSPISVNKSSVHELLVIPFLTFRDAQKIIYHRNFHGYFMSKRELYSVDELDQDLVRLLIPLISLGRPGQYTPATPAKPVDIEIRSRQQSDLQSRSGFTSNAFQGDKYKLYNRMRIKYGSNYSLGVLTEKDPGEKDFADFSTFYFHATDVVHSDIILGDFISRFGQGLVLWSPYSLSKGTEAVAVVNKSTKSFYPNSSSDENRFFRGAAVSSILGNITLNGFYSGNKVDANIDYETDGITSLPESGFHRTDSESDKIDKITNTSLGLGLDYFPFENTKLSLLYLQTQLSKSIIADDKFGLSGRNFTSTSVAYNIVYNRLHLSGEIASNNKAVALIGNLALKIASGFAAIMSIRNYPYNYTTLYSNGLGEGSNTQNEFGVYTGFKWNTGSGIINFYYDQFKFPYKTYSNPLPSSGNEFVFNYSYRVTTNSQIKLKTFLRNEGDCR